MNIIDTILWPIKWVVELILVAFHELWSFIGLDPYAGLTWVLSIVGLVLVIRAALIPIFVKQIKSQVRPAFGSSPMRVHSSWKATRISSTTHLMGQRIVSMIFMD